MVKKEEAQIIPIVAPKNHHCSYWWIVTFANIAQKGDIPTFGLVLLENLSPRTFKKSPNLVKLVVEDVLQWMNYRFRRVFVFPVRPDVAKFRYFGQI